MGKKYFTPGLFKFLRELEANNDKHWWERNKDRYIELVREPALEFISDFSTRLAKFAPHFTADSKTVGGSLMRPYRDVRFSKDKTPYKTHIGMQFRHVASKDDVHAPGLYLHIEPGASYAGVGLWRPATADAYAIRAAIASDPAGWKRAAYGKRFADAFTHNTDDTLVRVPKGFDPDHPFADDIRRKDFIGGTTLTKKQVTGPTFLADYATLGRTAKPFMGFLCNAIGVSL